MEDFEKVFPVGAKVRCESEMYPGKWEYGEVKAHMDGAIVDYDYRWLDSDPHNSLVRRV